MDKKVWAIIVIGALHLTLMWALRGSLKPEELARAEQPAHPDVSPIVPNPYLAPQILAPEQAALQETNPSTPDELALIPREHKRSTASRKQTIVARTARPLNEIEPKAFPERTAAFTPPVFNDTVIVVKHLEVRPIYEAKSVKLVEPRAVPVSDIRPIEKRKSFFKRAGSVVRKPYDWIKTLVTKL